MRLVIRTDGGSRGNPGPAAAGLVVSDEQGRVVFSGGYYLGRATNNVAEYEAVLRGLVQAERLGGTELQIFSDSELLVRQVNGEYRVKNASLRVLYEQVMERLKGFEQVEVKHVRREANEQADAMVNAALDARKDVTEAAELTGKATKALGEAVHLAEKVKFQQTGPYRESLEQEGGLLSELICLGPGQQCQMTRYFRQATITVIRGEGTVRVGQEECTLETGWWLALSEVEAMVFATGQGQQLAVIVTGQA